MPTDPRKRQKKLEQKASRRKEKKHIIVRETLVPLATRFSIGASLPILHSCMGDSNWTGGIGQATLSRLLPNGQVLVATFLVDRYCLGVKSSIAAIVPRATYDVRQAPGSPGSPPMRHYPPAAVRKYVEGAVAYAHNLGFLPDEDYEVARLLFGDIDPTSSPETFEYGKDGKPCYINGPYENAQQIREILATLERTCGHGNYNFVMMSRGRLESPPSREPQ